MTPLNNLKWSARKNIAIFYLDKPTNQTSSVDDPLQMIHYPLKLFSYQLKGKIAGYDLIWFIKLKVGNIFILLNVKLNVIIKC